VVRMRNAWMEMLLPVVVRDVGEQRRLLLFFSVMLLM